MPDDLGHIYIDSRPDSAAFIVNGLEIDPKIIRDDFTFTIDNNKGVLAQVTVTLFTDDLTWVTPEGTTYHFHNEQEHPDGS